MDLKAKIVEKAKSDAAELKADGLDAECLETSTPKAVFKLWLDATKDELDDFGNDEIDHLYGTYMSVLKDALA